MTNLKVHLDGELHVTGDMGEYGHSGQGHQHGTYKVTRYPAGNLPHQHPSAVQHAIQVKSHTGDEKRLTVIDVYITLMHNRQF